MDRGAAALAALVTLESAAVRRGRDGGVVTREEAAERLEELERLGGRLAPAGGAAPAGRAGNER